MRLRLEQLAHKKENYSFICYEVSVPSFKFLWHYHPEYELTYIIKGSGKRLVGDTYEEFTEGDFILIPPMMPHTWISENKSNENCRALVIQFTQSFLEDLFQFSELKSLNNLFNYANRGLQFIDSANFLLLLQSMIEANEIERFSLCLQLFYKLSIQKAKSIVSLQFNPMKGNENQKRINTVFKYVQTNFKEKISLKKAASLVHLSETAFCKFFKRTSGKTFSEYTNEIRIAYACQLLIETDETISAIAFQSGFDSLTYFNRIFLKLKKVTPRNYRKG